MRYEDAFWNMVVIGAILLAAWQIINAFVFN